MSLALILAFAMVLDALLGEPEWLWARITHPAVLMGRAVGWMETRFNRGAMRRMNGAAVVIVLVAGAVSVGLALAALGPIVQILCAAIILAQRSLVQHVSAVADAVRLSVADGRRMVSRIVSRDCREMTQSQVARAAIESGSENLSDGVIAPAFWFLVAGLPGLFVYKIVNTADSMIGYRNARYEQFGWAAARLDDLLNLLPARLTGVMIAALSGGIGQWGAIARDARLHRSPNAGWPEAAMARALNIALSGPRSYDGNLRPFPWVNDSGKKEIGSDQIDASVAILWYVWWAILAGVVVISILLGAKVGFSI